MHPIFARLRPQLERARREMANLHDFRALAVALPPEFASRWGIAVTTATAVHNIYNGLEEILKHIAADVDGVVPEGDNWHQNLLDQMSVEIEGVRPPVISGALFRLLTELRQFRHVVRHRYGMELDPARVEDMLAKLEAAFPMFESEFQAFVRTMSEPPPTLAP